MFTAYLVKFQQIFMDFISYRIQYLSWTCEVLVYFNHWPVCTISASQENSRSPGIQVSIDFQGFLQRAELLHLGGLQYIFGLFYQEKDAEFLHGKKIVTAHVVEVQ